jgi:hypothetical protein
MAADEPYPLRMLRRLHTCCIITNDQITVRDSGAMQCVPLRIGTKTLLLGHQIKLKAVQARPVENKYTHSLSLYIDAFLPTDKGKLLSFVQ